jgi:hypothetical protein
MGFECPNCGGRDTLIITASLELPPDNRSDEISLQTAACKQCEFWALAVYEESRRGVLDCEAFDHTGYPVNEAVYSEVAAALAVCASPHNAACACPVHSRFSRQDKTGRWAGLEDLLLGSGFNLVYQPPAQSAMD